MNRNFQNTFLISFIAVFTALLFYTISDYGVTWDAAGGELFLGDRYFHFFTTLDPSYLDPNIDDTPIYHQPGHPNFFANSPYARQFPNEISGFGLMLTSITKHCFYEYLGIMDPIDAHHVAIGLISIILFIVLFRFVCRYHGCVAAMGTLLCLVVHPRFWADLHNNPKDVPEVVFFSLVILFYAHGLYANKAKYIYLAGISWGAALASKGNALFLPVILTPWFLTLCAERYFAKDKILTRRMFFALPLSVLIACCLYPILWPFLLADFPNHFMEYINFLTTRGVEGVGYWQLNPLKKLIFTTPVSVLFLFVTGFVSVFIQTVRGQILKSYFVLLCFWLAVPVIRVSIRILNLQIFAGFRTFSPERHAANFQGLYI